MSVNVDREAIPVGRSKGHENSLWSLLKQDVQCVFERDPAARTRLEILQLRREALTVRAPADGILVDTGLPGVGQWCAHTLEVAQIIDPSSLVVEVAVPLSWSEQALSTQAASLELGKGVENLRSDQGRYPLMVV